MPRSFAVSAALFLLVANTAAAQAHFGVAVGTTSPNGAFGDIAKSGYHFSALVPVDIAASPAGLRFDGTLSEMNYKFGSDSKARLMYVTANATAAMRGPIAPYLIGGVGMYNAAAECSGCTTKMTRGGFNGGGGVKFSIAGHATFVEARFHNIAGPSDPTNAGIAGKPTQFIPISFGWII